MTSITAQKTKLGLKLVPKKNGLDIRKCNGRITRGLKPYEETFQVVLDALALTHCYLSFVITTDVPEVYMHQFWKSVYKHHDCYRFKIDKKKDSNLPWKSSDISFKFAPELRIKTLMLFPLKKNLFSENSVILGLSIHSMIPQMKESKAYKTYLSYATGTVPPKVARKFKKASPSKKDSVSVAVEEEPVQKDKRVKRSIKKSSTTPTTIIVIREPPIETQSKRKEKVDVAHGKGIDLLVVLVREEHESNSEQDTYGSESDSKFDQQDDDDDEVKYDDDDEVEDDDNADNKSEGDEDRGMDSDDVQDKKADVRMTDARQEKENLEITQEQVIEDAHSTPSPLPTTETTNILPLFLNFASVFRFNDRVIALEKDVAELKNDHLHTQVTALVDDHLDTRMGETIEKFINFLSTSLTDRITKQVKNHLPQILPEELFSKGTKSQPKSSRKSVHTEEPEFKVRDIDTPQGQEGNQGNDNAEPRTESDSRRDWNLSTLIDFSSYILNGLKIKNPTQEILLGPASRLLKGTRINYAELEYDFEECYKALLEKLDWESPEGGDYLCNLSKPLPLITRGSRQSVPVEYFINNDLKYLQGGVLTMTYMMYTTKTKAAQYDLLGIKDMVKENKEKDKIKTKPDKNEKRGEAEKSQKQLQSRKQEKLKKMQVEGPKLQIPTSCIY
nr:hypothetical protein [Tanacetum cinerariifolium]